MFAVSLTLIPLFLIILLGYVLNRLNFLEASFWPSLEKITYFVFFPALLVNKLSAAPLSGTDILPIALVLSATVCIMSLLLVLLRPILPISGAAFSSVFQGGVRFNSYLGLAIALILAPELGVVISAVALIAMVPLLNTLCVVVLAHYASHKPAHWRTIITALSRNPLVLGCIIGISLNLLAIPLPSTLQQTLSMLGSATLPLGLLAVGAALRFSAIRHAHVPLLLSAGVKLILFPLCVWTGCHLLAIAEEMRYLTVMFAALPTATSSYILARQMGGDYTLMANIITLQTLLAAVSLPLMLTVLA